MKSISVRQCRNTITGKVYNFIKGQDDKFVRISKTKMQQLESNQVRADSYYTNVIGDKLYQGKVIRFY